jgi:hypothetical protein
MQTSFVPQTSAPSVPAQPPQFAGSICLFVHVVPLHETVPVPQHTPLVQLSPAVVSQTSEPDVPAHAPQFASSVSVFTHEPLQFSVPVPQQMPLSHDSPAVVSQTSEPVVPAHAPQFVLLVSVSTQTPLQFVWPMGQHLPDEHSSELVHDVAQLPQWSSLVCRSKHWLPQAMLLPPQHVPFWQVSPAVVSQTSAPVSPAHAPQCSLLIVTFTHVPPQLR